MAGNLITEETSLALPPGILQAGTQSNPYYTNSSQLPVGFTDDPFDALERQDELQRKYTGGTVLHLYLGERVSSATACRELVKRAFTRFGGYSAHSTSRRSESVRSSAPAFSC